jgi:hypothetical protein
MVYIHRFWRSDESSRPDLLKEDKGLIDVLRQHRFTDPRYEAKSEDIGLPPAKLSGQWWAFAVSGCTKTFILVGKINGCRGREVRE